MKPSPETWPSIMQAVRVRADCPPSEVVRIESPALSTLNAGTGSTVNVEAMIAAMLLNLLEYFGMIGSKAWSQAQVVECAELWATEYYWMTAAELKLFIKRCKTGYYTKDDYRHLSPQQLMGWVGEYADALLVERRMYAADREAVKRHEENMKRQTDPKYLAFDLSKALETIGRVPHEEEKTSDTPHDEGNAPRGSLLMQCKIVAQAIADGSPNAMLPQYRQIHANYPEYVEHYLQEIKADREKQNAA